VSSHDFEAEIARMRAEADQSRESMKDFAGILRGFFDGLVSAGFSEDQALSLVQTWLTQMLQGAATANMTEGLLKGLLGREDGE
jgi:predicted trehalose synthase